jgi:hypothetical protein
VGGIAGCKSLGGLHTCATSVPVEGSAGGDGTVNSHWRESVFGNELMTGFINAGKNPLSIMTIRSLEDLGYVVDTTAADPFTPNPLTVNLRAPGSVAEPSPIPGAWEIGLPHRPIALPTIPLAGAFAAVALAAGCSRHAQSAADTATAASTATQSATPVDTVSTTTEVTTSSTVTRTSSAKKSSGATIRKTGANSSVRSSDSAAKDSILGRDSVIRFPIRRLPTASSSPVKR